MAKTLHHHQYSLSILVFMLLISWNTTQVVAAEYMKVEVLNLDNVYVTQIRLGTPTKTLSLALDMTTDLIWFMCGVNEGQSMPPVPLPSKDTMPAGDSIPGDLRLDLSYNLNLTSSYSYIFGDSPLCPDYFKQYHHINNTNMCNSTTLCSGAPHVGSQVIIMYESMDVLNMSGDYSDFTFACTPFKSGIIPLRAYYHAAGVLGLGRGEQSFVSQLGFMYDNYFSYCLPPSLDTKSSLGYFALGKQNSNTNNKSETITNNKTFIYTPLIDDPWLYLVEMTSVTINGTRVSIDSSESSTALDPGTLFTTLPAEAYMTMCEIVLAMNVNTLYNKSTPGSYSNLPSDICFNTSSQGAAISIPSIEITFGGNAKIVLDRSAVIYVVNSTVSCLAFRMSKGVHNTFGGVQQANTDVLIDLGNHRVGFRNNTACSYS